MSRHMACKLCRDRKVRCNGEVECESCRRSGEPCVYIPTQKPTKSDLIQTIEILQGRLEKAEAFLAGQNLATQCNTYTNHTTEPISLEDHGFEFQIPTFSESNNELLSSQHTDGPPTPENSDAILYDLSPNRPSTIVASLQETPSYNMDGLAGFQTESFGASNGIGRSRPTGLSHIPTLHEVRAMNTASSYTVTSKSSPQAREPDPEQDCNALCASLARFLMLASKAQGEIAGISSAVAEYLSWMQREPTMSSSGAPKANYMKLLEALEARVREIHDLSGRHFYAACQQLMTSATEVEGLRDKMKPIEEEMHKHAAEVTMLFKQDYDICASLSEQNQPS
ncbi:hypothetical protein F5Y04DRAFT_278276 [Hypomontagnella monticulosa]|nr:hypothetical protein F5Y04DRAFT_278276 [Hypomontagnella monticulosa]